MDALVEQTAAADGRTDSYRERQRPGQEGADHEKGQAVEEAIPDFFENRLVVFPRNGLACEKIFVEQQILHIQRFVQVKLLAKPLHHFGGEFGVHRVDLAGLSGRQVNNQKRHHRHEKQGDDFLDDAAPDKRDHFVSLSFSIKYRNFR